MSHPVAAEAAVRQDVCMTTPPVASEVWQARIGVELAEQLRADADLLGLEGRTEIVKEGLRLLHQHAAQERMARSVQDFYGDAVPPRPIGVRARRLTEGS